MISASKDNMEGHNLAISAADISKAFIVPHERRDTLKEGFINLFRKRTYEHFRALDCVSFQLRPGEFLGIVGRNGSGKSTLLKILAGIYRADSGKLDIRGEIAPFLELGVGFQQELSARENIYLNGTLLGLTRKEIKARFDSIVDFAGVRNFIDLKIKNFSSGMRARLAFAIAKEADADIYLFDEIMAVGDEDFQQKCLNVFREWKDNGKTVVFVSHTPNLVEEFCNRAILLDGGKVVFDGTPGETITEYHRLIK